MDAYLILSTPFLQLALVVRNVAEPAPSVAVLAIGRSIEENSLITNVSEIRSSADI